MQRLKWVVLAVVLGWMMVGVQTPVAAQYGSCGIVPIKPIPPIGCDDLAPQCVCVKEKNGTLKCEWTWVCVKRDYKKKP